MPSATSLSTRAALLRERLRSSRLTGERFASPEDAVSWFGAVQAQDYAGAKWALGQRLRAATDATVEGALARGSILRTHVLRPTWHFVRPVDIRWMLELSAPRIRAFMAYYDRKLGLDEAIFKRSNATLAKALQGGQHLTRDELARVLQDIGIRASGQRLGHLVMRAELDAILCSGARRGKQFTYASLDERVPKARTLSRDEALAELARRYVQGHGPCLTNDFAWWSGQTVSDAKSGLVSLGSELEQTIVADKTYWHAPGAAPQGSRNSLNLLPNFDEYLIAYKDHGLVLDDTPARALGARDHVLSNHLLVVNGKVAGGWQRTLAKSGVTLEVMLLAPLSETKQRALVLAAERYARFLELPLTLRFSKKQRKAAR
jgi:hypothetical protein